MVFRKPFVLSLANILLTSENWAHEMKKAHDIDITIGLSLADKGWVDNMRESIAVSAIEQNADIILWLDTDMTFPADILTRMYLLMEGTGVEAVTGLYTYKHPPFMPHVYGKLAKSGKYLIASDFPIDKPFFVEGAGFGCLMMKTSVFKRLKRPYFKAVIKDSVLVKGEDLDFCKKSKMKMLLDPTISCGHCMDRPFAISDYLRYNDIEVKDGFIRIPEEKRNAISEEAGFPTKKVKK
jgi:hypothetical protein